MSRASESSAGGETSESPLTQRDIECTIAGSATPVSIDQAVLASLLDIKHELKEEIDTLHHKMSRIDSQISEILRYFSPTASPYTSNSSSCCSSTHPSATTSGAPSHFTSPKASQPASPPRLPPQRHLPVTPLSTSLDSPPHQEAGTDFPPPPPQQYADSSPQAEAGPQPPNKLSPTSNKSSSLDQISTPKSLPSSSSQDSNISGASNGGRGSGDGGHDSSGAGRDSASIHSDTSNADVSIAGMRQARKLITGAYS